MKKIIILSCALFLIVVIGLINSCAVPTKITDKSGAQLWGEICNRCHTAPSPEEFNNKNWDIICAHMQVRAKIPEDELAKIKAFLTSQGN